jgi:hypothetical protein
MKKSLLKLEVKVQKLHELYRYYTIRKNFHQKKYRERLKINFIKF